MELININAEMTGNVWKVLVAEGDKVSEGDELIILESMKMEIPIISPATGSIKSVNVEEGDFISEGQLTLTIEE